MEHTQSTRIAQSGDQARRRAARPPGPIAWFAVDVGVQLFSLSCPEIAGEKRHIKFEL